MRRVKERRVKERRHQVRMHRLPGRIPGQATPTKNWSHPFLKIIIFSRLL